MAFSLMIPCTSTFVKMVAFRALFKYHANFFFLCNGNVVKIGDPYGQPDVGPLGLSQRDPLQGTDFKNSPKPQKYSHIMMTNHE